MRRLYLQIYVTVVITLTLFAIVAGLVWRHFAEGSAQLQPLDVVANLIQPALPAAHESREAHQAALDRLHERTRADLALFTPEGEPLGTAGAALPPFDRERASETGRLFSRGERPAWAIALDDGRWLIARLPRRPRTPSPGSLVYVLGIIAVAVAVGAYPVTRRLTRRLERLQASVEALGGGDLGARVKVEGRDEVSRLAQSFNRAAERISELVGAHRQLLANASHELRSPLARIRVGIDMLKKDARPELRTELERDIAELDALVEEILLASRLGAVKTLDTTEDVDLLALAAEECARSGAALDGAPAALRGDARLLRRLIRNLLDNARRYGAGTPVDVEVGETSGGRVELKVSDRGPGVPEAERERIFEPFYRPPGARESAGGVGLGLALVRQIARRHGGDAQCLGRDGGGSCFRVEFAHADRAGVSPASAA